MAAALWVGAGFCLAILAWRMRVGGDAQQMSGLLRAAGFMGDRVFAPLSIIVLIFGFILVAEGDWGWDFWLIFGLVAWAVAAAHGAAVLGKRHERIAEALAGEGWSERVTADFRSYHLHTWADVALVALVILDMTWKPFL